MNWREKPFGWGASTATTVGIPFAQDAMVSLCQQLMEMGAKQEGPLGKVQVSLSCLEAPSTGLAMAMTLRALQAEQIEVDLELTPSDNIPEPDPRASTAAFNLWRFDDVLPATAVEAPRPEVSETVCELAIQGGSYDALWQQAGVTSQQLTLDDRQDLAAAMVHPLDLDDDDWRPWEWLQLQQVAAGLLIGQVECQKGTPLDESILVELLMGPIDWSMDAAIVALVHRTRHEPTLESDVFSLLFNLVMKRLPDRGYWSTERVVFTESLRLPNLPPELRTEIEERLKAMDRANE